MEAGLNSAGRRKSISIADRKEAIKTAVSFANSEDIILLAGKGHEKYQVLNTGSIHFDDKEVYLFCCYLTQQEQFYLEYHNSI